MTLLTDEMVEKAARAILKEVMGDTSKSHPGMVEDWLKVNFRPEARAALLAVLPDVVEEIAKQFDQAAKLGTVGEMMIFNRCASALRRSLFQENENGLG